ncbi:MAG: hypothetical protein LBR76_03445 [Oscillospiraceae bacterium]|jgi:5-hydroxyisourate hydrolase-like protein (transthyretin family)|nr:hypothetical protein [Oscillospiraceae bacterium]
MRKITSVFLALLLLSGLLGTVALADPLDDNGETGGTGPGEGGSYTELWSATWYGMRITVVDVSDPAREIAGEQWGKVADGTVSVDITNLSPTDNFFTRTLAGDNSTALTFGNKVTHFGVTSKMAYRDGAALSLTNEAYEPITVSGLPKLMGNNAASAQTIKSFINNQAMLTNIAQWCGGGLSYETLISGKYKILAEPVMYCLIDSNKLAFTPTEAAKFKPHGESTGYTLINNTLANAFFLEHGELGWDAWTGATDVKQPWDTIINYLGMHIYSITPNDPPDPPEPTTSPPAPPSPPPPSELEEGKLEIVKVEYGTNIPLDGAEFEIIRNSHWERRLTDPDEDDTEDPNPDGEDWDDVWEWLEVHDTEVIGTYTTVSGLISLDLEPGSFTVREVTPPAGYTLDANPVKTIDIPREAGSYTPTLTFENKKLPGLIVKKVDEDTGDPLAGAEFSVARKGGSIVYEGVTPEDGIITVTDLPEGWYTVTELAAPSGYLKRDESKDVFLPAGETVEIKFDNRRRPALEIVKVDAQTKQPLSGAKFRVWNAEGSTVGEYVTGADGTVLIPDLDEAIYSVEEIAAPEGYLLDPQHKDIRLTWGKVQTLVFTNAKKPGLTITKFDETTGEALPNAEFTVARKGGEIVYEGQTDGNGQIHLSDLEEGWYTVTETVAPDGYLIVNTAKDVFLEGDAVVEVRFANIRKPTLTIRKYDELTGEPLAGAGFRLWKTEGETWSETLVTDANGVITWTDLDPGIYSIQETDEPYGYFKDPARKEILLNGGDNKQLVFFNRPRPTLSILKRDLVTGEPLEGVKFRVQRVEGETIGEFLTDANGRIELSPATGYLLSEEIYRVTEIAPPDEYLLSANNTREVLLKWREPTELVFENLLKPTLIFIKRNGLTGRGISDATYKIEYESENGGIVGLGTVKTKCGLIVLPHVLPGWYILTETKPAPGYSLPTNPVQRLYLAPGENSYTYQQTRTDLYVDPRTDPNNGERGNCGDWCGYLCSTLCAGNCGQPGGGSMSGGESDNPFGGMTITNGNGNPIGTVPNSTPDPSPIPSPTPSSEPDAPPADTGGVIYLNPDFPSIRISFGD